MLRKITYSETRINAMFRKCKMSLVRKSSDGSHRLLQCAQIFGYDLFDRPRSCAGKWLAKAFIAFVVVIIHVISVDYVLAVIYDTKCHPVKFGSVDDVKFILVKSVMAVSLDFWLYHRKAIIACYDTGKKLHCINYY